MKVLTGALACLFLIFGLAAQPWGQTEIASTGVNYGSSTVKISPVDEGIWVGTAQQMGIRVDDSGEGPFHMMSTDIQLILYGDKTGVHHRGFETHVDQDGDKVLWEIWDSPPGSRTGKGKIIGGTGKFEGIEGTMDYTLDKPPMGFPKGTSRTVCRETMKVTLKSAK